MERYHIEVTVVSASRLPRSFPRPHWFAIAWIIPAEKHLTGIDTNGTTSPVWNKKFVSVVDVSRLNVDEVSLHVEVYRRDPVFLRRRLQSIAVVPLRELLMRVRENPSLRASNFQLRKRKSGAPCGSVEVAVRVAGEASELASPWQEYNGAKPTSLYGGSERQSSTTNVGEETGLSNFGPPDQHVQYPSNHTNAARMIEEDHQSPLSINSDRRPTTPPPPPPPSHTGFLLPFFATNYNPYSEPAEEHKWQRRTPATNALAFVFGDA